MDIDDQVLRRLIKVYKLLQHEGGQVSFMKSAGPGIGKERILLIISENEDISLKDLAEKAAISKVTALEHIKKLEGYVERKTVKNHYVFSLTPEGEALVDELRPNRRAYLNKCFANLDYIEKSTLNTLLGKLLCEIKEAKKEKKPKSSYYREITYHDDVLENYRVKPTTNSAASVPEPPSTQAASFKPSADNDGSPEASDDTKDKPDEDV